MFEFGIPSICKEWVEPLLLVLLSTDASIGGYLVVDPTVIKITLPLPLLFLSRCLCEHKHHDIDYTLALDCITLPIWVCSFLITFVVKRTYFPRHEIAILRSLVGFLTSIATLAIFPFLQVILAIAVSWIICAIITAAGGFPSDPSIPQYKARVDARTAVLREAQWFRLPYPG